MKTVAILMSTYNGEKYLREQLDSILAQVGVEIIIYVRDDGSSDGTKEMLAEYEKEYSNFHVELGENCGVGNSFMNLLYSVPATYDYYAFSDQDDVWEENKICEAVKMLEEHNALLYTSNQLCVDSNRNDLGLRYSSENLIHTNPVQILSVNMVSGCTMVFPNSFYKILTEEAHRPSADLLKIRIHDVWLAEVASLYGGLVYDERAFIKYRQHENNVVGAYREGFVKRQKQRIKKLFHPNFPKGRSLLAKEICLKFPDKAQEHPVIELLAQTKSFKDKKKILKSSKELRSYTKEGRLSFFIKVMFGWI